MHQARGVVRRLAAVLGVATAAMVLAGCLSGSSGGSGGGVSGVVSGGAGQKHHHGTPVVLRHGVSLSGDGHSRAHHSSTRSKRSKSSKGKGSSKTSKSSRTKGVAPRKPHRA